MPHWFVHGAWVAGRLVSGVAGCICFYLAFFLYEDEEGHWQNRLDNLWVAVHDRAQSTSSTTTALFNKLAETVKSAFNRLFGHRLFSITSVGASLYLSYAGSNAASLLIYPYGRAIYGVPFPYKSSDLIRYFITAVICLSGAYLANRLPHRWGVLLCTLPLIYTATFPFINLFRGDLSSIRMISNQVLVEVLEINSAALIISLISDFIVLVLIRKLFVVLSRTISMIFIISSFISLILVAGGLSILPLWVGIWTSLRDTPISSDAMILLIAVGSYNLSTAILCLVPAATLSILLAHRVAWPLLSRLLYPFSKYAVMTNKRVLLPIGTLCCLFAFNLQHVGIKDLLKILPS